jgi:energy-coupling factor transporter ATP-binding protein EcfA2
MYLKKVHIQNIKSIKDFEMEFEKPAGWHVLLGDNGSGKSTILRAIALGLVGKEQAIGLRADWRDWLKRGSQEAIIKLLVEPHFEDLVETGHSPVENPLTSIIKITQVKDEVWIWETTSSPIQKSWNHIGWFSAAFGPFRRFEGGNPEWKKVFEAMPRLGAHLSVFGEDVALTESLEWLMKLNYQALEKHPDSFQLECIMHLVNSPDFLPNGMRLERISSEGVQFANEAGELLPVSLLSDGYRSILSMTFELIRQMVGSYSSKQVFKNIQSGEMIIDLPGVVLIDEIDVHLHPSWQLRIGEWFLKYFPKIQFIVTTHSPLICRASEKGSIWHLKANNSEGDSPRISKLDYDRLVYGNILDAYGTELFGKSTVRSQKSDEKRIRLGRLNLLAAFGKITDEEEEERKELQMIMTTDDPFEA